jgi:hypothetical protein
LKEIEPSPGRQKERGRAPARFSRKQAAREAGLSDYQRKTALRIANVA